MSLSDVFLSSKFVPFVFISLSHTRSFSIIHVSVDIKIWSERRLSSVDDFSLDKSKWFCDVDLPPELNAQVLEMRTKEARLILWSGRYYTELSPEGEVNSGRNTGCFKTTLSDCKLYFAKRM